MSSSVWAIIYTNWEGVDQLEIDTLWATEKLARERLKQFGTGWQAVEWIVGTEEDDEYSGKGRGVGVRNQSDTY